MPAFLYRAVDAAGRATDGSLDAVDQAQALTQLRQRGLSPIEVREEARRPRRAVRRIGGAGRRAAAKAVDDLGVLLSAGLSIDRALALAIDNIERPEVAARFAAALRQVREGVPLSRAISEEDGLLPPMAEAMIGAGEANGRLGEAMTRLAATLEAREDLRQLVIGSAIYPAALLVIATGVILLMLLFVIPQFETVFASAPDAKLPASSMAIMAASRFTRHYGWLLFGAAAAGGVALARALRSASARAGLDRLVLRIPQLGIIVQYGQTAQLARTLAVLVDGGVDLPAALGLAQRSLANSYIAAAVARAVAELREGGGLSGPLAATGVFPAVALGFFRTGEETSRLAPMLDRLADMLEREVRSRIARLVAVLTPAITVILGGIVATVIASIMSAILGFNDLAVG